VRLESITGAVQTTKSLMADITVPYWIENEPGDTLWLFEDDPKARLYAERAIPLIRSVPEIAAMLEDVNRNDKTKTELKFKHMKLVMCGLNAGNVQSLRGRR
jgi:phage terminase large subunit GpA-like protein